MLRRLPLEYLGVNSTAVSKHGHTHPAGCPSFETRPAAAPQDEVVRSYFRIAWLSSGVIGRSRKERMRPRIVPKPVWASSLAG